MGKFILHIGLQLDTSSLDKEEGEGGRGGTAAAPDSSRTPSPEQRGTGSGFAPTVWGGQGMG